MKLDLKPLAQQPGEVLPFELCVDLSDTEWNGARPFVQPVHVEGQVRNRAGALELKARLDTVLSLTCDRCAKPFEREKTVEYETLLAFELANGESGDSSLKWTRKTSAPRIARDFVPDAVWI